MRPRSPCNLFSRVAVSREMVRIFWVWCGVSQDTLITDLVYIGNFQSEDLEIVILRWWLKWYFQENNVLHSTIKKCASPFSILPQVMRRLREREEPIRLFGETDREVCLRLRYTQCWILPTYVEGALYRGWCVEMCLCHQEFVYVRPTVWYQNQTVVNTKWSLQLCLEVDFPRMLGAPSLPNAS